MMAKKKNTGLGKGLDALFGDMEVVENTPAGKNNPAAKDADSIDIDRIKPNAGQPRKTFDEAGLADLAASIKEHGVIQPIIVRKKGKGKYARGVGSLVDYINGGQSEKAESINQINAIMLADEYHPLVTDKVLETLWTDSEHPKIKYFRKLYYLNIKVDDISI